MIKYDIREISGFANRKVMHSNRYLYYCTLISEIILKGTNEGIICMLPNTIKILNRTKYAFRSYHRQRI